MTKKRRIEIKAGVQLRAEPYWEEDRGMNMVLVLYNDNGVNRGGFITHQSEFDLMFEYVDEVDFIMPAAVAANAINAYAVGIASELMEIAKGLPPEDELVTQEDYEETLNCDEYGNVW